MKLGLYVNLCNPPSSTVTTSWLYRHTLDLIAEADRSGLASVWFSEHHLRQDGYLPQPLTFAAAVAARTERIRIGTSVLVLPLRNVLDVVEQAAVVDLVSGGRLELGVGPGYVRAEFDAFGADHAKRIRTMWRHVARIEEMWRDGVRPRPVQEKAPLWIGVKGPKGVRRAGEKGLGLLRIGRAYTDIYLEGLAAGGHDPAQGRMSGPINILLSDDPERDWPQVRGAVAHQWTNYAEMAGDVHTPDNLADAMRARGVIEEPMAGFALLTPEEAARQIRRAVGEGPVEHVYVWATLPGLAPALTERNIELAVNELAPLLDERTTGV